MTSGPQKATARVLQRRQGAAHRPGVARPGQEPGALLAGPAALLLLLRETQARFSGQYPEPEQARPLWT